jgi:autotransporter-associated beta strand protein
MNRPVICAATAAACLLGCVVMPATAQEKGELWETTSQAVIPGSSVKVPAISGQTCAKKDWTEGPASGDPSQHCQNRDFNRSGNKVTWKVVCENPPMNGEGELTFSDANNYTGALRFNSGDTHMQVVMTGKKIGSCDNPK